jgi:hypothetical protein
MEHFKCVVCNSSFLVQGPVSTIHETESLYLDIPVLVEERLVPSSSGLSSQTRVAALLGLTVDEGTTVL